MYSILVQLPEPSLCKLRSNENGLHSEGDANKQGFTICVTSNLDLWDGYERKESIRPPVYRTPFVLPYRFIASIGTLDDAVALVGARDASARHRAHLQAGRHLLHCLTLSKFRQATFPTTRHHTTHLGSLGALLAALFIVSATAVLYAVATRVVGQTERRAFTHRRVRRALQLAFACRVRRLLIGSNMYKFQQGAVS